MYVACLNLLIRYGSNEVDHFSNLIGLTNDTEGFRTLPTNNAQRSPLTFPGPNPTPPPPQICVSLHLIGMPDSDLGGCISSILSVRRNASW